MWESAVSFRAEGEEGMRVGFMEEGYLEPGLDHAEKAVGCGVVRKPRAVLRGGTGSLPGAKEGMGTVTKHQRGGGRQTDGNAERRGRERHRDRVRRPETLCLPWCATGR